MADIFLSPVIEVILDKLASPILGSFGNLWDLKDNIEKLRRTLPMVQALLDDAEQQQLTNLAVKVWLSKLKDVTCEAEDLLVDFTSSDSFMPPNAEKVREMLHNLEMITSEGFCLNLREGSASRSEWGRRETFSCVNESEVYGRDDDKEKVIQMLLSPEANQGEVPCVTIVGMGGLGKTTLAQLAFNDQRVLQYFDVRSWVFVSDCFDVKRIMVAVIESISEDKCSNSNLNALHSSLRSLLHNKRYLIVLDDVWTEDADDWEKLKLLLRGGADGSKLLITTRNKKVENMMDSTFAYHLQCLSDDDCWRLFKKRAFRRGEEEKYPSLLPIGRQIVRKCGGLALAAKSLGSLLRFKREAREWLFVQDSELWNLNECESGILPILRLSYRHLPLHLRRCFAFCSIFPRSFEFKKDKLIHLWIAEGLIHSTNEKLLEVIGNDYFNDLLWISFFEEVKHYGNDVVMRYKMHDVIYDLVRSMTGTEYAMLDCRLSSPGSCKQIRHASVVCDFNSSMIADELYEAKHLRTLLLFSGGNFGQLPYKLYSSFRYLLALDLSGSGLVELDGQIYLLSCLRFLDLSYTPIKLLPPGIVRLPLETLNLFNCYALVQLPNLNKMRKLRHLNNIGCDALTGMLSEDSKQFSETIMGTYELQTVPLFVVHHRLDMFFLGMLNLSGSLNITHLENVLAEDCAHHAELTRKKYIESLGLYWGNNDGSNPEEESAVTRFKERGQTSSSRPSEQINPDVFSEERVLNALEPPHNLKRLLIKGYPGNRFPHWSLPYLNVVKLINCRKSEQLPTLGNLQFLTHLSMRGMHGVRSIRTEFYGEGSERPFAALRELVLIDFPNLEEWLSPDGGDAFPSLSKLVVKECPKLAVMPQVLSIQHLELRDCKASLVHSFQNLTSLEALVIEKVRDLFSFSGAFPANNSLLTSLEIKSCLQLQQLPYDLGNLAILKSLTIRWCEALSFLPQSLQSLGALESLEIGDCHSLIDFPEGGTKGLSNLRTFSVENCNNLISLSMGYQYLTSLENLTIMYCPSIGSFPRDVEHLSALRSLTILCCPQFISLPEGLQNLKLLHSLEIRSCPGLKALPEWIEKLVSLRSLAISDCHNVKVLPEGIKSRKALQHLSIQDCPQLLERCREQGGEDWPKIAHVPFKHIGSAEQTNPSQAGSSSSA